MVQLIIGEVEWLLPPLLFRPIWNMRWGHKACRFEVPINGNQSGKFISGNIFADSLGSKALLFHFFLSTRLKGQISLYREYWACKTPFFRSRPHYCENHKVVSLIEPDTGCKLIRASSQGASNCPDYLGKTGNFFFSFSAPCFSYWARLATPVPKISATLWLHKWSWDDCESCWLPLTVLSLCRP